MRPRNGPSMSNAGVSRVGPPDFKSFRKKRTLSIGDEIIWSESGKVTYQGKSRKKRRFNKRRTHKQPNTPRPSKKVSSTQKRAQQRALKMSNRAQKIKRRRLRKETKRMVQKRAKRLERILREIKIIKLRKTPKPMVNKRPKKSGRLLRKIKISKPEKKTDNTDPKTLQPWVDKHGTTKMELIQSILRRRRGQRGQ